MFLVGLGVGLVCGIANGAITAVGRVPSLVVTLAMLYIIRGVDTIVVGLRRGRRQHRARTASSPSRRRRSLGIPDMALAVIVGRRDRRLLPQLVPLGPRPLRDRLRPAGGAARGHPDRRARVHRVRRSAARSPASRACVWASQYATINSTAANGLELQIVAAVVVGGVAIFGGSGSVVGAALGALLLQTITSALNTVGVSSLWTEAIAGFLLVLAITLDRGIQLRLSAALRRRRVRLGA